MNEKIEMINCVEEFAKSISISYWGTDEELDFEEEKKVIVNYLIDSFDFDRDDVNRFSDELTSIYIDIVTKRINEKNQSCSFEELLENFIDYKKQQGDVISLEDIRDSIDIQSDLDGWFENVFRISEEELENLYITKDSAKKGQGPIVADTYVYKNDYLIPSIDEILFQRECLKKQSENNNKVDKSKGGR